MTPSDNVLHKVKPPSPRPLPPRHDLQHAVAFHFHDELADLARDLGRTGALSVSFDLHEQELEACTDLEGEALWRWLRDTGRQDIIDDLTYRQITAAVLSDAAHFICESLLASGKGKMTVAFALLRKPFKENLLLLEWLLAKPADFLSRFQGESTHSYTLNRLSIEERREILHLAASVVDFAGLDDDVLWLIRYDKDHYRSLECLWTKASHLVTTVSAIATEPGNLNFVFSSEAAVEDQWEHYYFIAPLVLYYFILVAEAVAARFVHWDRSLRWFQVLRRQLAFLRYTEVVASTRELGWTPAAFYERLAKIRFSCTGCEEVVTGDFAELDRFWLAAEIVCKNCCARNSVWDLLEDEPDFGPLGDR